ncbi:MAG: WYL domain-containing protein, partial [Streptomyces sp.]
RIAPRPPHGPRFEPRTPPADDLAAYVSKGVSTRAYAAQAVLRLLVPLEEAAQRITPSDGTLEAETERSCLLRTGALSLDVMVIHVLLMGFEFEVVEPADFTERIGEARDLLSRALDRGVRSADPDAVPPVAGTPRTRDGADRTPGTRSGSGAA